MTEQVSKGEYFELLLVEDRDGNPHVVKAPAFLAEVGGIADFAGQRGVIKARAVLNVNDPMAEILMAMVPIVNADAIHATVWRKPQNGE